MLGFNFSLAGGLRKSRLIDRYVISHFLPFLPLEKKHVRNCIRTRLQTHFRRFTERTVDEVIDHLQFVPIGKDLFALKGCKNVAEKVNLVIHKRDEL